MRMLAGTVLCAIAVLCAESALAAAGTVELVDGDATIVAKDGSSSLVRLNQAVSEGDTVSTGAAAEVHLRMADQMLIAIRQNTRLRVDVFRAQGDEGDSAAFALFKGTMRAVSGWIGRYNRAQYSIRTATVTIGIRGTDHEPAFFGPETTSAERGGQPPGTYDKVNQGETYIRNARGEIAIGPGGSGFAPHDASTAPGKLDKVPGFYRKGKNEAAFEGKVAEQAKLVETKRAEAQEKLKEENAKKSSHKRAAAKREVK